MKNTNIFKKKRFWNITTLVAAILTCAIAAPAIIVPSFLNYQAYYNEMVSDREHQKYLASLPLEFKGISATLADGAIFYANGRAHAKSEDFKVVAHFTEKGKDFDTNLLPYDFSVSAPDDFAEKGGAVTVSYTYTYPDDSNDPNAEPRKETKETQVNVSLTDVVLSKLEVLEKPYQTVYPEGAKFDSKGMTFNATYNDGTVIKIGYLDTNVESDANLETGQTSVKVVYNDGKTSATCDVPVTVLSQAAYDQQTTASNIVSLKEEKPLTMNVDDSLSTAKPILRATYQNGNKLNISDEMLTIKSSVEVASMEKNCYLDIALKDNPNVKLLVPVNIKMVSQAENFASNGGSSKDVDSYILSNGNISKEGQAKVVEGASSITFTINSEVVSRNALGVRLSNRTVSKDGKSVLPLDAAKFLSVKINDSDYPASNAVISGYGKTAEDVAKYVFEELTLPDVVLNKGINKIELSFNNDLDVDGVKAKVAVDSISQKSESVSEFYQDIGEAIANGDDLKDSLNIEKISDFGVINNDYGNGITSDGTYLYSVYLKGSNATVVKIDSKTGEAVAKSKATGAFFQEYFAGITIYDGQLIIFKKDGGKMSTSLKDFKEGSEFKDYDGFKFEGLDKTPLRDVYYNQNKEQFIVFYGGSGVVKFAFFDKNFQLVKELSAPKENNDGTPRRMTADGNYIYINYFRKDLYTPVINVFDWEGNRVNTEKVVIPNTLEKMGITSAKSSCIPGIVAHNNGIYFSFRKEGSVNGGSGSAIVKASLKVLDEARVSDLSLGEYASACVDNKATPSFTPKALFSNYGKVPDSELGWTMGGVSDGENIYLANNLRSNEKTQITKIDKTKKIVANSVKFETGGKDGDNSQLFIKDGKLYCILFNNKIVSIKLDSFYEGIALKEDNTLPFDEVIKAMGTEATIKGVQWNESAQKFIVLSNKGEIFFLDAEGKILKKITSKAPSGYTLGSVTSDSKFFYVSYKKNTQADLPIDVYTWDGTLVSSVTPRSPKNGTTKYNIQSIFTHQGKLLTTLTSWDNANSFLYLWNIKYDQDVFK